MERFAPADVHFFKLRGWVEEEPLEGTYSSRNFGSWMKCWQYVSAQGEHLPDVWRGPGGHGRPFNVVESHTQPQTETYTVRNTNQHPFCVSEQGQDAEILKCT